MGALAWPGMSNAYYEPGGGRAARVLALFGAIATRYDWINDLQSCWMHRAWKRRLVGLADPQSGEWALDLCCGTGDIAALLSQRGAAVVGLDFSGPMLEVARGRHQTGNDSPVRGGASRAIEFVQGDGQHLPFCDASFDVVTMGYGLRNLADWRRGLEEMWRVLKPRGRLGVLEFGKPSSKLWREIYFAYLRCCVPVFGKLFCGDSQAYAYILESLRHYPAQEGLSAALAELGCAQCRTLNLWGGAMSITLAVKGFEI